ncbi:MAG: NfeD family protein, partial [Solirubrobacteraceae bacterium]
MDVWVIWLVAACVLGVGEMHQGGFYLAPFAVGAGLAAVAGLVGLGAFASSVVFLAVSALVFATLRPIAQRHRRIPP